MKRFHFKGHDIVTLFLFRRAVHTVGAVHFSFRLTMSMSVSSVHKLIALALFVSVQRMLFYDANVANVPLRTLSSLALEALTGIYRLSAVVLVVVAISQSPKTVIVTSITQKKPLTSSLFFAD